MSVVIRNTWLFCPSAETDRLIPEQPDLLSLLYHRLSLDTFVTGRNLWKTMWKRAFAGLQNSTFMSYMKRQRYIRDCTKQNHCEAQCGGCRFRHLGHPATATPLKPHAELRFNFYLFVLPLIRIVFANNCFRQ